MVESFSSRFVSEYDDGRGRKAMIVVMNCGPGEMHCRALKCLTYMTPSLSAGALKGGQQVVAGLLRPKSRNGIFMEHEDADPRALVPLVGPPTPAIISTKQPGTKSWQDIQPGRRRGLGRSRAPTTTPDR